jgi:SAM-dependent methyltransferase
MISPQQIITNYSVEELCETADKYFQLIRDPSPQMAKPFSSLVEAPEILQNIGQLLSGLHLAKTMSVLDFCAGTCWLSRFIMQLQCSVICCDVSKAALNIGKRLFEEYPIVGDPIAEPMFLHFNGRKIDLPSAFVDRIVCNDGFHHVPNQSEVLAELARVLKPGGIAGFSEPGPHHSQSPTSQYEMENYKVLENDIKLEAIFEKAKLYGFTDINIALAADGMMSLPDYLSIVTGSMNKTVKENILTNVQNASKKKTIFFLHKGTYTSDSRSHQQLFHKLETRISEIDARAGEEFSISLRIRNSGAADWLHVNTKDIGVVKIGTHLYNSNEDLLDLDFSRHLLPSRIPPGTDFEQTIRLKIGRSGRYQLKVDLVSEGVCWFENLGSKPASVIINVCS